MPSEPLRIALAGLGTVGAGVVRLLDTNGPLVAARAGRPIVVTVVCARDRARKRAVDLARYAWEDDMILLADRDDVDVVVELVGGADGLALTLARRALQNGKSFVTANKAMIAHHGMELAELAEGVNGGAGVTLSFEAAVAGGIPAIKGLAEGAAANACRGIFGILNGTCNYILSKMEASGADFPATLAEAQELGYAESDPAFDIEGTDAAHKLAILAAIGFGTRIDFPAVDTNGITAIRAADIAQAAALGHVIRLIGLADMTRSSDGSNNLFQRVAPYLVPKGHPLASVDGATNAVVIEGDFFGRLLLQGAGAGAGPTASAVVADLIDIARGNRTAPFALPVAQLASATPADAGERLGRSYIRLVVADRPGVLAQITAAMRDAGVSIESLMQQGQPEEGGEVLVVLVTHEAPERAVAQALSLLEGSSDIAAPPLVMRLMD